ncbi:unnamed protein product [Ilex paraguariensis]|uniref:Uncharacterized protein n=1 Tax=Ilex paraguariensis TaxID=185542 RepID=A0ABC8UNK3_9AQUA
MQNRGSTEPTRQTNDQNRQKESRLEEAAVFGLYLWSSYSSSSLSLSGSSGFLLKLHKNWDVNRPNSAIRLRSLKESSVRVLLLVGEYEVFPILQWRKEE